MSEKPSRYDRTFPGLIGAMIVTLLAVVAFVAWRGTFRDNKEVEVPTVDWRQSVELAQEANLPIVAPTDLPDGWRATSVDLVAVGDQRWGMGVLTDSESFVGLRQQDASLVTMVETYIDKDAESGGEVTLESSVSTTWETWSDDGGDLGYATEVGDDVLLVYGSAGKEALEEFIALLEVVEPAPAE